MPAKPSLPAIPLPRGWSSRVKSAILHVISLAQFTAAYTRGWAANSVNTRIRLKAELDRALQDHALLREEMHIKDVRLARIAPHQRPLYPPTERMAILEVKAARGWSLEQAAKAFLVTAATIASWMGRVDEQGPAALVQLPEPVSRFPDFVRYLVQRLKTLCPMLGKVKIAQILGPGRSALGADYRRPHPEGEASTQARRHQPPQTKERVVTSKYPNHLWMTDLTTMPIGAGFLGHVAALLAAPVLAVLLVDRRGHRPLLAADHGRHAVLERTDFASRAGLPRSRHARRESQTQALGNRQGAPVLQQRLQAVVPTQAYQTAFRGHRSTRLHCRGRAADLDAQTVHRLAALGAAAARSVPA